MVRIVLFAAVGAVLAVIAYVLFRNKEDKTKIQRDEREALRRSIRDDLEKEDMKRRLDEMERKMNEKKTGLN